MVCGRVNCRRNVIFAYKESEKKPNAGSRLGTMCV